MFDNKITLYSIGILTSLTLFSSGYMTAIYRTKKTTKSEVDSDINTD
jgi:hypothetical protein